MRLRIRRSARDRIEAIVWKNPREKVWAGVASGARYHVDRDATIGSNDRPLWAPNLTVKDFTP